MAPDLYSLNTTALFYYTVVGERGHDIEYFRSVNVCVIEDFYFPRTDSSDS